MYHSTNLRTLCSWRFIFALASLLLWTSTVRAQPSITTQMYDNHHDGWNPNETTLTVANVKSSFQLLFKDTTDDGTYAQPLYVPGLSIAGGTHNVIFVATENNTVYAFDADSKGAPLWSVNLTPAGETLQSMNDYANTRITHMGISGTPVIDTSTNTLYVVAASKTTANTPVFHQRLHALNITNGSEQPNSPVDIQAKFPGSGGEQDGHGNVLFDPLVEFDRGGLTLFGNTVYIPFGAHEDNGLGPDGTVVGNGLYEGWVIAYDKTSLAQVAVFNTDPSIVPDNYGSGGGSIWQAAVGMVADDSSIYALSANGQFNANTGGPNYGDSLLRLTSGLGVADYFAPCDQYELYANDVDLGSGAPMILPDQPSGPKKLITFAGKEGSIYLLDRTSLGHYTATQNTPPQGPSTTQCTDNVVQVLWRVLGTNPKMDSTLGANRDAYWGAPSYFQDSSGKQYVYYTGDYSPIIEYDLVNGQLMPGKNPSGNAANQTPGTEYNYAHGGTLAAISSNGGDTTTAVLWAIKHPAPPKSAEGAGQLLLDAFPANDLTNEIVVDVPAGNWTYGNDAFLIPTVANGKVYVSSSGEVDVFGVSSSGTSPPPSPSGILKVRLHINFGRLKVARTRSVRFRVYNVGKGPLQATVGTLQAPFTVLDGGSMTLQKKKASPLITVQFAPTAIGLVSQTLTITSSDPNKPTWSITVEGIGK